QTTSVAARPSSGRGDDPAPGSPLPRRAIVTLVLCLWGLGSALLLARSARSWRRVYKLRRSSVPVLETSILRLLADVGRALELPQVPRVLASRGAHAPLAFGLWNPFVIVPDRLIGAVGDDEMRDVLLHELAHLSRRDPLVVILQELGRAFYWPI